MLVAWVVGIAVDLLLNAGVFMSLFDQEREPSLLPDAVLFRRIPVAYLALLVGVASLAWMLDRIGPSDIRRGAIAGAAWGLVLALMGVVSLWTAIEMTGIFVAAAALVAVVQFASVGAVLTAFRLGQEPGRLTRRFLLVAFLAAALAVVIQNLQS